MSDNPAGLPKRPVHNHGPEEGPGLACRESLVGDCVRFARLPTGSEREKQLASALVDFGDHRASCARGYSTGPCDCGFDDALALLATGERAATLEQTTLDRMRLDLKHAKFFGDDSGLVKLTVRDMETLLAGASPSETPPQEVEECDEDCQRCSGEYCATHFDQPCDCDTADRHYRSPTGERLVLGTLRVDFEARKASYTPAVPQEPQPARCTVCNWPLAASVAEGCVPGNCSYRP